MSKKKKKSKQKFADRLANYILENFYVNPNILQKYGNYIITDPSGKLLQTCAKYLADNGYKIKVLNVNDMAKSLRYNPFYYVKSINDISSLVETMLFDIEGPIIGFWDPSTRPLLTGICNYLFEARPMEERTFSNVAAMLRMIDMQQLSSDPNYVSPLDRLFEDWDKKTKGQSYAVKQYKKFKIESDTSFEHSLISTAIFLDNYFNLPEITNLTCKDEMELDKIGKEKIALFLIIPVDNPVYNFFTSALTFQLSRILNNIHRENSDNPSLKERT